MYDAIIIGARCAGSSLALLLARKGYRVLLADRTIFPSDTISTHLIWAPGLVYLRRWGLLPAIAASNCPLIRRVSVNLADPGLTGSPPPCDGIDFQYCPRRTILDKVLAEAAAVAGAELREAFTVEDVRRDSGRVTGIRGHSRSGRTISDRARVVVGADGVHSMLARATGAAEYNARPAMTCLYYSYWTGVEAAEVHFIVRSGSAVGAFPTNDGLTCIVSIERIERFAGIKADVEQRYLQSLEIAPEFRERVRAGRRVERIYGTAESRNFFRRPYGDGWALLGDAGYHKDPVTAQGITDAFRDAESLADALDEAFSGRRTYNEVLAQYERRRNDSVLPMYELTCHLASLDPAPEQLQLTAALDGQQEQVDRFVGTFTGAVPMADFYAPENVARVLAAAGGQ